MCGYITGLRYYQASTKTKAFGEEDKTVERATG